MKRLHIFRAGRHTASCGTALNFDENALQRAVDAYDPAVHEAPIVAGHPKDNGPAFGWIKGLSFADGNLHADPHQVNPDFEQLVKAGSYKKISASFYSPDAPTNPVPGAWYLRHVGFLGAQPPAIKGLEAIGFAEAEAGVVLFDEPNPDNSQKDPCMTPEEIQAAQNKLAADQATLAAAQTQLTDTQAAFAERETRVAATEAAQRLIGINDQIERLVKQGKVLPVEKLRIAAFMASLADDAVVTFSEDGKDLEQSASAMLIGILSSLPKRVDFEEHAPGGQADLEHSLNTDKLAREAVAFQEAQRAKGIEISSTEAVAAVQAGHA